MFMRALCPLSQNLFSVAFSLTCWSREVLCQTVKGGGQVARGKNGGGEGGFRVGVGRGGSGPGGAWGTQQASVVS